MIYLQMYWENAYTDWDINECWENMLPYSREFWKALAALGDEKQ